MRSAAPERCAPGCASGRVSPRRAQLLALEPSLSVEPLRGNIDTRLRKRGRARARRCRARSLRARPARARSGDRPCVSIPDVMLPEAGRVRSRCRCGRGGGSRRASPTTPRRVAGGGRARCVGAVGGGCLAPVAAHHDGATLTGLIASGGGSWLERRRATDPDALGRELAALERRTA
jgi:hydroxymethylbilane synthase